MLANAAADANEPSDTDHSGQPAGVKGARLKQPESRPSQIVTVRSLVERFIRVHVGVHLKPGTANNYRTILETVILPNFGNRDFRSVTRAEVAELHGAMKDRPGAVKHMLMVISSLYTRIIQDWELADKVGNDVAPLCPAAAVLRAFEAQLGTLPAGERPRDRPTSRMHCERSSHRATGYAPRARQTTSSTSTAQATGPGTTRPLGAICPPPGPGPSCGRPGRSTRGRHRRPTAGNFGSLAGPHSGSGSASASRRLPCS